MTEKIDWNFQELDIAISSLAANLLRIMAGAGRAVDLERQLKETNNLTQELYGYSATRSEQTFEDALRLRWPVFVEAKTNDDRYFNEENIAISAIATYSLRIAAAKITGNNSQISTNKHELLRCLRHYCEENKRRAG